MRLIGFLTAIILMALTACGPSAEQLAASTEATAKADPCSRISLPAYGEVVELLVSRYEAQAEVVAATPRVSLGTPLQALLGFEDEARAIVTPACLTDYNAAIVSMMERYRKGYQAFAAQQADVGLLLGQAETIKKGVNDGIVSLRQGQFPAPIAIP